MSGLLVALSSSAILYTAGGLAIVSLGAAVFMSAKLKSWSDGNDDMRRLAGAIRSGAMAFLRTEYMILSVFVAGLAVALPEARDSAGGWLGRGFGSVANAAGMRDNRRFARALRTVATN